MPLPSHRFDCQLYVSAQGRVNLATPYEPGPRKLITLKPLAYEELISPEFRRLLAAFDRAPQTLQTVQV